MRIDRAGRPVVRRYHLWQVVGETSLPVHCAFGRARASSSSAAAARAPNGWPHLGLLRPTFISLEARRYQPARSSAIIYQSGESLKRASGRPAAEAYSLSLDRAPSSGRPSLDSLGAAELGMSRARMAAYLRASLANSKERKEQMRRRDEQRRN